MKTRNKEIKRNKDTGTPIERYKKSFFHAIDGIVYAIEIEHNMLIIMLAFLLVSILCVVLPVSLTEIMIVVILTGLVMITEFINTAIEAVVDLISPEINPLAKIAKDTASSASLISSCVALICGIIIFLPKIIDLF